MVAGLRTAAEKFPLASAGIDSWGCDYGLLDTDGALVGNPVHYRDARTDGVTLPVSAAELYSVTGIQHLPFNTIFQLGASLGSPSFAAGATLLMIPDLLAYWLTGEAGAEVTNASTTALLDVAARTWAVDLMERVGIPTPPLFPPLRQPGEVIGPVTVDVPGLRGVPLTTVGSHDTASAVVAVPATERTSPTSPRVPGRWWALSWPARWCPRRAAGELHERGGDRRDRPLPAER